MQTNKNNRKVKKDVPKYKDNSGDSGSVGAYGGNNLANLDAGKLRHDKIARLGGAWKAFVIFSALVIIDYFLTIYAIRQHFSEFNPLTVSIYKNFQNPEMIFLFFKAAVIALNGLLVYLMIYLGRNVRLFKKIALAYALLAAFFAFAVVIYDVGIITGALALPEFANSFIFGFFKFFGMI